MAKNEEFEVFNFWSFLREATEKASYKANSEPFSLTFCAALKLTGPSFWHQARL